MSLHHYSKWLKWRGLCYVYFTIKQQQQTEMGYSSLVGCLPSSSEVLGPVPSTVAIIEKQVVKTGRDKVAWLSRKSHEVVIPHKAHPALALQTLEASGLFLPHAVNPSFPSWHSSGQTPSPVFCTQATSAGTWKSLLLFPREPALLQFGLPSANLVGGPLRPSVARDCTSSCFGASPNPQVCDQKESRWALSDDSVLCSLAGAAVDNYVLYLALQTF